MKISDVLVAVADHKDGGYLSLKDNNNKSAVVAITTKKPEATENRRVRLEYYDALCNQYGSRKVEQVARDIGFRFDTSKPLSVETVARLNFGFNLVNFSELEHLFNAIKQQLEKDPNFFNDLNNLQAFADNSRIIGGIEGLKRILETYDPSQIEAFKQDLAQAETISKLSAKHFALFRKAFEPADPEWKMLGRRIDGVISGPTRGGFWKHLFYDAGHERREMVQLFDEPFNAECPMNMDMYNEWIAKVLVKKTLFSFDQNNEPVCGLLIPAPPDLAGNPRYYRVENIHNNGAGKLCYKLVPACDNYDQAMPDIIAYRSTSSDPAMLDSFTTVLSDCNPTAPPGYWRRRIGEQEEDALFNPYFSTEGRATESRRPLVINGHSLGGSHAQLALHRQIVERGLKPNVAISSYIFDSPKIKKSDAAAFRDMTMEIQVDEDGKEKRVAKEEFRHVNHYYLFSHGDMVPHSGGHHLGFGCDNVHAWIAGVNKGVKKLLPVLDLHCHHRRYTFDRDQKYTNIKEISIESFDKRINGVFVEALRVIVGLVLFPVYYVVGFTKRAIVGRRGYDSKIVRVVRNRFSLKKSDPIGTFRNRKFTPPNL